MGEWGPKYLYFAMRHSAIVSFLRFQLNVTEALSGDAGNARQHAKTGLATYAIRLA